MARDVTPDGNDNLNFQERATDVDGDTITLNKVELDAINGTPQSGADRNPAWLSHTTTFNAGALSELLIDVTVDSTALTVPSTYDLLFEVTDGQATTTHTVSLNVTQPAFYDITSLSFTGNERATIADGFHIGSNGSKAYFIGENDKVDEWDMSTPYDLSTINFTTDSLDISSEDAIAFNGVFDENGSKMFILGADNENIFEYSLSTPWSINTASYTGVSYNAANEDSQPQDIKFNNDGSKLFLLGQINNQVYEYNLGTPYDISTISYSGNSFSVSGQEGAPTSIAWDDTGTKLFMAGNNNSTIYQYDLTSSFDITTASYSGNSLDISSIASFPSGLQWNNDGTKIFVMEGGNDRLISFA